MALDIEVEASHAFTRGDVSEGREVSFRLHAISFAPALEPRDREGKISSWEAASEVLLRYVSEGDAEDVAGLLAIVVYPHLQPPLYERSFRMWEEKGFHVTPVSHRSPIPHSCELGDELRARESELPGIDLNEEMQLHLLRDEFPQFVNRFAHLPMESATAEEKPGSRNQFGGTDALCPVLHDPALRAAACPPGRLRTLYGDRRASCSRGTRTRDCTSSMLTPTTSFGRASMAYPRWPPQRWKTSASNSSKSLSRTTSCSSTRPMS